MKNDAKPVVMSAMSVVELKLAARIAKLAFALTFARNRGFEDLFREIPISAMVSCSFWKNLELENTENRIYFYPSLSRPLLGLNLFTID